MRKIVYIAKALIVVAVIAAGLFAVLLPSQAEAGTDPYLGEIMWVPFNFAPRGWAFCDGQLLPISQNQALFSLLGTMYGGDGNTTFALPDMRSRTFISSGQGNAPGATNHREGEKGGAETHTLTSAELADHSHAVYASSQTADSGSPTGNAWAVSGAGDPDYGNTLKSPMASGLIGQSTGGGQPHNIMQPYITLHCIIALQGVFPSRN